MYKRQAHDTRQPGIAKQPGNLSISRYSAIGYPGRDLIDPLKYVVQTAPSRTCLLYTLDVYKRQVIDTSTVDPQTTRGLAARVGECGAAYLDCPILGRPSAAGKWMLPTGGSGEALEKVKPVLLCFAANAVLVGDSGAGNALKMCIRDRSTGSAKHSPTVRASSSPWSKPRLRRRFLDRGAQVTSSASTPWSLAHWAISRPKGRP